MNNETKSKDYYKDLKEDFLKSVKELEEKVNNIKTSDEYIKWLEKLGTVNQYSINNIEYLFKQNPSISYVASFNTWKKYGRSIKKGEKALKVFAPILKDINKVLENEGIISNEENKGEKDVRIVGFRTVNVFDISQTEGKPFDPQIINVKIVNNEVEDFKALRYALEKVAKIPVIDDLESDYKANGYFATKSREIHIKKDLPQGQFIKTLIHEIAHSKWHGSEKVEGDVAEIEAESTAFLICRHLGIDTSDYSFPYIAYHAAKRNIHDVIEKSKRNSEALLEEISETYEKVKGLDPAKVYDETKKFVEGDPVQDNSFRDREYEPSMTK